MIDIMTFGLKIGRIWRYVIATVGYLIDKAEDHRNATTVVLLILVGLALFGVSKCVFADGAWMGTGYFDSRGSTAYMYQHDFKNKLGMSTNWRLNVMAWSDDDGNDLEHTTITGSRTETVEVCETVYDRYYKRREVCHEEIVSIPTSTTFTDNESNRNFASGGIYCKPFIASINWGGAGCIGPMWVERNTPHLRNGLNVYAGVELRRGRFSFWPLAHVSRPLKDDRGEWFAMFGSHW